MQARSHQFIGIWDVHKQVMIVRTIMETIALSVFLILPRFFPWFKNVPHLWEIGILTSTVLGLGVVYLIGTIYLESKNKSIKVITYLECITDAVMVLPFIHFVGGVNGPLFFFYSLMIMEAAATFSTAVVFSVTGLGIVAVVGDSILRSLLGEASFSPISLIALLFRILFLFLISVYGRSLSQSILKERETRKNLTEAYEELKKLDKAKSEFVSIASHQLRTPLTAVKGYISMMIEGGYGKLPKKLVLPLKNVYESNEKLIKLVNDLLDLTKLEAGKIEFTPTLGSLEKVVSDIIEELKINADKRGLYIKLLKPKQILPDILFDQPKVRQVILNIIDNAIKYTKEGGVVIELRKTDSKEQIIVSDTGVGITQEEAKGLFQMFSRAASGVKLHTDGSGVGLHVAKKFIEMHQGRIWVESIGKNKGSSFYIELPIKIK